MTSDWFVGVIVPKPWGCERLLRSNQQIELWHLRIRAGESTSFHCHPTKKTGLVVLSGQAIITFMNDDMRLSQLGKVMIRPGLFHQTTAAISDLDLLEIETPPNKTDLVRLTDQYGRAGQPYESVDCYTRALENIELKSAPESSHIAGCVLSAHWPTPEFRLAPGQVGMVLAGGIMADNKYVLSAGDIVNDITYNRLAEVFQVASLELLVMQVGQ